MVKWKKRVFSRGGFGEECTHLFNNNYLRCNSYDYWDVIHSLQSYRLHLK